MLFQMAWNAISPAFPLSWRNNLAKKMLTESQAFLLIYSFILFGGLGKAGFVQNRQRSPKIYCFLWVDYKCSHLITTAILVHLRGGGKEDASLRVDGLCECALFHRKGKCVKTQDSPPPKEKTVLVPLPTSGNKEAWGTWMCFSPDFYSFLLVLTINGKFREKRE